MKPPILHNEKKSAYILINLVINWILIHFFIWQGEPGTLGFDGQPGADGEKGLPGVVGVPGMKGDTVSVIAYDLTCQIKNNYELIDLLNWNLLTKGPRGVPGMPGLPGMDGLNGLEGSPGYSKAN